MEPVYETAFALRAPDTDFCGAWRPGAMFTAMQELGEACAIEVGAAAAAVLR